MKGPLYLLPRPGHSIAASIGLGKVYGRAYSNYNSKATFPRGLGPFPGVPCQVFLPCKSEQVSSRRVGAGGPGPLLSSDRNWGSLSSSRSCSARTARPAQGSRSGRRSAMGKRSLSVARGAESRNTVCCSVVDGGSVCGRLGVRGAIKTPVTTVKSQRDHVPLSTQARPRPGQLTSRPAGGSGGVVVRWSRAASRSRAPSSTSVWKSARSRTRSEWQWQVTERRGRLCLKVKEFKIVVDVGWRGHRGNGLSRQETHPSPGSGRKAWTGNPIRAWGGYLMPCPTQKTC